MRIRIKKRKKQNTVDNNKEEFLKQLDEHIKWIKKKQIKSKDEKLVEFELVNKEEK
jgi:flagellar hook-basal body complex protein FliE